MKRTVLAVLCVAALAPVLPNPAQATQLFADQTAKHCDFCHIGRPDQLQFTKDGELFIANYYQLPGKAAPGDKTGAAAGLMRSVRRLLLSVHAISAMSLLGLLAYMGLAAPRNLAVEDVPPRDRRFMWLNFGAAAFTGAGLVPFVFVPDPAFWMTTFGAYLGLKAALFIVLGGLLIHNATAGTKIARLRWQLDELFTRPDFSQFRYFSADDLRRFTGLKGRAALVAHKGKVYEVTRSAKWTGGMHFNKHSAGADLTAEFAKAPHGEGVLGAARHVGTFDGEARKSGHPEIGAFEELVRRHQSVSRVSAALAMGLAVAVALWRQ